MKELEENAELIKIIRGRLRQQASAIEKAMQNAREEAISPDKMCIRDRDHALDDGGRRGPDVPKKREDVFKDGRVSLCLLYTSWLLMPCILSIRGSLKDSIIRSRY